MEFLRRHWFDLGIVNALIVGTLLLCCPTSPLSLLLWISLISLFLHQFEEYRWPGNFPFMMNTVMYKSKQPDRYPLNPNTALIINVDIGWSLYLLAALFAEKTIWLAIATILISLGNFIAHTFLFNIRGKTFYNPGMVTADLLFLPIVIYFFYFIATQNLATPLDWYLGIPLGIALNYIGVLKTIDWLKDEKTPYVFARK